MKQIVFKNRTINKPDNISNQLVRSLVSSGDNSMTAQNMVNIIAAEIANAKLRLTQSIKKTYINRSIEFSGYLDETIEAIKKEKYDATGKN